MQRSIKKLLKFFPLDLLSFARGRLLPCTFTFLLFTFAFSCGSSLNFDYTVPSQTEPYVSRVVPSTGKAGDVITIFGSGFSSEVASNIVSFGSTSISADGYALLASPVGAEIESITVTLLANITIGDVTIYVTVFDNTSNADIGFTITP